MTFTRASGILLHPTSLPGAHGIGDLGPQAHRFLDWLSEAGCKLWQVLPLGPTGYGDSPYQCFSAFAGNPYLISFDLLLQDGLLTVEDLKDKPDFPASRVDFGLLIPWKLNLLRKAFDRFRSAPAHFRADFDRFCADHASWLDDFALFMALKESYGGGAWSGWPEPVRLRKKSALTKARKDFAESIRRFSFYQFLFFKQWNDLRAQAKERGIRIIGDIPIFVAYDSAEVWSHPELFFLDENGTPTVVAGVPPDRFSATGQLWGNPLYNWEAHRRDGYKWWLERIAFALQSVDILRFDHFRGFAAYYEIPAGHSTAEFGRWVPGPGADLFEAAKRSLGGGGVLPFIAEDLGIITPDVVELLEKFDLPGMRVLQFAFTDPDNPYLPHNYIPHCVVYTGTHDNNTAHGWFDSAPESERHFARRYLNVDGSDIAWDLIRAAWSSVAVLAIAPMQDILNLDGGGRMNHPSHVGGNWEWRMGENDLRESDARRLRELNFLYGR